jgi:hypothetical protein
MRAIMRVISGTDVTSSAHQHDPAHRPAAGALNAGQ